METGENKIRENDDVNRIAAVSGPNDQKMKKYIKQTDEFKAILRQIHITNHGTK